MQLAIDILAETPAALRLAANFLLDHALQREEAERGVAAPPPPVPADLAAHIVPPAPPPPPPVDNVVPFPPPAPPAPPDATAPATASSVAPAVASVPPPPAILPAASASDIFDDSGVPWDARIHQKGKSKKKDGTWKLQKGIDPNLVEAVMRELTPRIRSNTPSTVGASPAPVTLPGAAAHPGTTGAPPNPPGTGAGAPVPPPPPPPGNLAPPPPPPPAVAGSEAQAPITTPGAEGPGVDPFRSLVTKITKARQAGKITPDEVTQAVVGAGCPSLQLLNNMAHLIPTVDATIDAILAMR